MERTCWIDRFVPGADIGQRKSGSNGLPLDIRLVPEGASPEASTSLDRAVTGRADFGHTAGKRGNISLQYPAGNGLASYTH